MFRSTFATTAPNKNWLRSNYKQLKQLVDAAIHESDEKLSQIQARQIELKHQESKNRQSYNNVIDRSLSKKTQAEVKSTFASKQRIICKIMKDQQFPMLYNDRIYKTMVSDSNDFYKRAMTRPDKMAVKCTEV